LFRPPPPTRSPKYSQSEFALLWNTYSYLRRLSPVSTRLRTLPMGRPLTIFPSQPSQALLSRFGVGRFPYCLFLSGLFDASVTGPIQSFRGRTHLLTSGQCPCRSFCSIRRVVSSLVLERCLAALSLFLTHSISAHSCWSKKITCYVFSRSRLPLSPPRILFCFPVVGPGNVPILTMLSANCGETFFFRSSAAFSSRLPFD